MSIRLISSAAVAALIAPCAVLAEVPQVATDIAPVHSLVARVMVGLGEPALIVPPGASPHGHAMRPSEARAVQEAEAIFWVGPELEPWLGDAIANLAPDAETVELLVTPGTETLEFRTGATFAPQGPHAHDDHAADAADGDGGHAHDEHGHSPAEHSHADVEHGRGHEEDDHAHDGLDPHAWLDPENGKAWLDAIAATLGHLDPGNADAYAANAEAGKAEIDAAVAEAREILAPVSDLRFVVFHDAYQYFETRFGLSAAGAIALSDASDPSPARIEEVRDIVQALEVNCVLSEPQFNQGLVRTVMEGSDVTSGVIDPMGSDIATGPDFYPQLVRTVAEELAACRG